MIMVCGSRNDTVVTTSRKSQTMVEVIAIYSHSAQAADLRLCRTAALANPSRTPETEREASAEPARAPR